ARCVVCAACCSRFISRLSRAMVPSFGSYTYRPVCPPSPVSHVTALSQARPNGRPPGGGRVGAACAGPGRGITRAGEAGEAGRHGPKGTPGTRGAGTGERRGVRPRRRPGRGGGSHRGDRLGGGDRPGRAGGPCPGRGGGGGG